MKACLSIAAGFAMIVSAVPAMATDYTDTFIGTISDGLFLGDAAKLIFTYQYPPVPPSTIVTGNVGGGSQVELLSNGPSLINAAFAVAGQTFNLAGNGSSYVYRQIDPDGVTETFDFVSGADPNAFAFGDDLSHTHALISSTGISAPFAYTVAPSDNANAQFKFADGSFSAFRPTEVTGGNIVSPTPELPAWASMLAGLAATGAWTMWRRKSLGPPASRAPAFA